MELFRNRLGSVILAVSVSTGAIAAEYDYDSFGQRTLVQGTEEVRYGFTSREHDAETGLIYYRARTYDPATGTFLQRDPIGFASGDLNLYAYVENDPYNATDPSGLSSTTGMAGNISGQEMIRRGAVGGLYGAALGLAYRIANQMSFDSILSQMSSGANDDGDSGADSQPNTEPTTGDPGCDPWSDPNCADNCPHPDWINFDDETYKLTNQSLNVPNTATSAEIAIAIRLVSISLGTRVADNAIHEFRYGRDQAWRDHQTRIEREEQLQRDLEGRRDRDGGDDSNNGC